MDFVGYPNLILLISSQTFKVTVVHEKFWELNRAGDTAGHGAWRHDGDVAPDVLLWLWFGSAKP